MFILTGKETAPPLIACTSPKDSSPEDCAIRLDLQPDVGEKASGNSAQVTQDK